MFLSLLPCLTCSALLFPNVLSTFLPESLSLLCPTDSADTISALLAISRARLQPPPYSARSQNRHSSYIPSFDSTPGPFHMLECIQFGGFAAAWAARDVSTSRILCFEVTSKKMSPKTRPCAWLKAYQRLAACIEMPYSRSKNCPNVWLLCKD